MYQDISTQSQDQGCFMFKTLGIFFQWILKIWIHSTLLQCSTAVDIIYQQNIEYIYYLYISVFELDVQISMEQSQDLHCISNKWTLEAHRSQGSKCDKSATNLQHQHCTSCTLLHLAAPSPQFSCKMSIWQFIEKKFLDSLETFYPILNV